MQRSSPVDETIGSVLVFNVVFHAMLHVVLHLPVPNASWGLFVAAMTRHYMYARSTSYIHVHIIYLWSAPRIVQAGTVLC